MNRYSITTVMLIILTSLCASCSTVKKEGIDAQFEIITSDYINPDSAKESRPLNIAIYYLTDTEEFLAADYFDLFQSDNNPLATSLVQKSSVLVLPNSHKSYKEEIPKNVRAIGVIYQFRELEQSHWRAVVDTPKTCFLGFNCKSILHSSHIFISVDELNTKIKLVD